ncbi:MAG: DUF460 domain-containing protein [Candidatus Altiarchaeales archaeon]|nr:DUF460 domain-containing protein [Candidatus Altiarchaeales archaeon]
MHLIVGVDPGTTTGIAVLNLEGKLVDVLSSKDFGMDKVISHIISLGRASLIATDVNPTPFFISKLSAQLGSTVFTPPESLGVEGKISLTRDYVFRNTHERDALAAALNAYNKLKNKLQKIPSGKEEIKHLVLQGVSIDDAIKKAEKSKKRPERKIIEAKSEKRPVGVIRRDRLIRKLRERASYLEEQLELRDRDADRLKEKIRGMERNYRLGLGRGGEIRNRDIIIAGLEYSMKKKKERIKELEGVRDLWKKTARGETTPVGVFPEELNGLSWIKRKLRDRDMRVLEQIETAFTSNQHNRRILSERNILVLGDKFLHEICGCAFISSEDLEEEMEDRGASVEAIIEEYRRERQL